MTTVHLLFNNKQFCHAVFSSEAKAREGIEYAMSILDPKQDDPDFDPDALRQDFAILPFVVADSLNTRGYAEFARLYPETLLTREISAHIQKFVEQRYVYIYSEERIPLVTATVEEMARYSSYWGDQDDESYDMEAFRYQVNSTRDVREWLAYDQCLNTLD